MYRQYLKFISYLKKYNVIENIFLLMSVIGITFISYIASFNFATLILIDASTVSKFILNLTFTYMLSSMSVVLIYTIFEYTMPLYQHKKDHVIYIKRYTHPITKNIMKFIIFLWAYVGLFRALFVLEFSIGFFIFILFMDFLLYAKLYKVPNLKEIIEKYQNDKKYLDIIKKYFGILVLFLAFNIGETRAEYIKNFSSVNLNDTKTPYVLYMTTSYGIGLWQPKDKSTSFVSWGNIKKVTFLSNTNRIFFAF